jgi:hypothetical protein
VYLTDFRNCTWGLTRVQPAAGLTHFRSQLTTRPQLDLDFAMSRLAYYPTPATRRLGTFTLDARPSTYPHFFHPFTFSQTAKRWTGSLGVWGVGVGTALVFVRPSPQLLLHTVLSDRRGIGSFCDAKSEKHVAPQHTCGTSLAFPNVQFLSILCPTTAQ